MYIAAYPECTWTVDIPQSILRQSHYASDGTGQSKTMSFNPLTVLCSSLLPSVIQGEMLPRTHVVIKYNARDNTNLTIHTTFHDVIMSAMVPQISGISIVYSTVSSGVDHREHQSSTSLAFVRGISRSPVNWLRPKCSSWKKILSLIYLFLDQRLISLLYFIVI